MFGLGVINMKKLFLVLIKFYQQAISAYRPCCCKFTPTCSAYAYQAINKFGCLKGLLLTIKRLLKCNIFCKEYGYDPVPDNYNIRFFDKF